MSLAEGRQPYNMLTERHLQAMWLEQRYFKNLATADGNPVTVISPGIWNGEAGPDFRKAHLIIAGKEVRGDIEIHLADESWYHHHHHQDDRYNDVALHVSFWKPKQRKDLCMQNGKAIPQAYFEPSMTIPTARMIQLIDLDLYPYKKFLGSGKCAHAIFRPLSDEKTVEFFFDAALWRLEKKLEHLQSRLPEPSQQLCAGIAMGLGYKNNTELFLDLFLDLQKHAHEQEAILLAMGMGALGFFDDSYIKKYSSSTLYTSLKEAFDTKAPCKLQERKVVLSQSRPFNHPLRRLVSLVKLICDRDAEKIYDNMTSHWESSWPCIGKGLTFKTLRQQLQELIPSYTDPYWNSHFLFEVEPKKEFLPLIGEDLKAEILINTFIPLLNETVTSRGSIQEMGAFHQFYRSFPSGKSGKAKYLTHRFFGDTIKGKLLNKAAAEQGAFQLHRDFCIHYEASCEGCPFVERFQNTA